MRHIKFKIIFFISIIFLVVGCTTLKKLDRSNEYQKTESYNKTLVLPGDLAAVEIEDAYPIPETGSNSRPLNASVLPPSGK